MSMDTRAQLLIVILYIGNITYCTSQSPTVRIVYSLLLVSPNTGGPSGTRPEQQYCAAGKGGGLAWGPGGPAGGPGGLEGRPGGVEGGPARGQGGPGGGAGLGHLGHLGHHHGQLPADAICLLSSPS